MTEQTAQRSIVQGLLFFPRGGSAQVIRYLVSALERRSVYSQIVSGSLGSSGDGTFAPEFFRSLNVDPVDYSPAIAASQAGSDPLLADIPLHPSFEDRPDSPDRIFTSVDPETGAYLETRWQHILRERIQEPPDLFHIHHLSPLQAAVRANWPDIPLIGHLHGTELKMLDHIRRRTAIARKLGLDLAADADRFDAAIDAHWDELSGSEQRLAASTRWEFWRYAGHWEQRLREYAAMCDRLIVLTESARTESAELLGFDSDRIHPVPNGVDTELFSPGRLSAQDRLKRWNAWLVDDPQGWDESGVPGSVRYSQAEIEEWFLDASGEQTPVLFYVGRFMSMKRVPLLIRAYKQAQPRFTWKAPLVIWGGNPGEWEREHPVTVAREEGVSGVFFVGWRGHDELPEGLNAADVMVAPSRNEPFGQVYLEAMACRLPVIATESGGPPSFINQRAGEPDGWLIPPDDCDALADAMVEVVNNPDERRRRGANALKSVRAAYSWNQVAGSVRRIYDVTIEQKQRVGSRR
jgi:D-inositol-3-phosphate glycosyltransferase